jgi:hypothetical protein
MTLGLIVLMLVVAGSVLAPDSGQSFPPERVFGWFTVLEDIYDPGKVAGVAVYIDAKQVDNGSEARELGNRIVDYIFVVPGFVRPGLDVGVQYPLTEKLMLEVEAECSQPYLASGLLSYQQFDHPDSITGSHGAQGSQAWADHYIWPPDDGWGDTGVMGNPLPDYNSAYATIRMSKDSFQWAPVGRTKSDSGSIWMRWLTTGRSLGLSTTISGG